jgi:hypothetical protein
MKVSCLIFLLVVLASVLSCKSEPDICAQYDDVLNGYFESRLMEGTWRFTGGKGGSIIIRGSGYNDMDCGYQITNCETGAVHMNCEGAGLDKVIKIISKDEIEVGQIPYKRVKK